MRADIIETLLALEVEATEQVGAVGKIDLSNDPALFVGALDLVRTSQVRALEAAATEQVGAVGKIDLSNDPALFVGALDLVRTSQVRALEAAATKQVGADDPAACVRDLARCTAQKSVARGEAVPENVSAAIEAVSDSQAEQTHNLLPAAMAKGIAAKTATFWLGWRLVSVAVSISVICLTGAAWAVFNAVHQSTIQKDQSSEARPTPPPTGLENNLPSNRIVVSAPHLYDYPGFEFRGVFMNSGRFMCMTNSVVGAPEFALTPDPWVSLALDNMITPLSISSRSPMGQFDFNVMRQRSATLFTGWIDLFSFDNNSTIAAYQTFFLPGGMAVSDVDLGLPSMLADTLSFSAFSGPSVLATEPWRATAYYDVSSGVTSVPEPSTGAPIAIAVIVILIAAAKRRLSSWNTEDRNRRE